VRDLSSSTQGVFKPVLGLRIPTTTGSQAGEVQRRGDLSQRIADLRCELRLFIIFLLGRGEVVAKEGGSGRQADGVGEAVIVAEESGEDLEASVTIVCCRSVAEFVEESALVAEETRMRVGIVLERRHLEAKLEGIVCFLQKAQTS